MTRDPGPEARRRKPGRKEALFLLIVFLVFFHLLELGYRGYQWARYGIPPIGFLATSDTEESVTAMQIMLAVGNPLLHYLPNPERPTHTDEFTRATPAVANPTATIACMGGSSTYGVSVSAESAYPARLQQELNEESPGYRVVNAGVPGWALPHHLARYVFDLRDRQPSLDVVILYAGFNDMWHTISAAEPLPGHADGLRVFDGRQPLWMNYRFLVWLTARIESVTGVDFIRNNLTEFVYKDWSASPQPAGLRRFESQLALFLRILRDDGVASVVVLQDSAGGFQSEVARETFELVRERMASVAQQAGAVVVDMRDYTKANAAYFADVIHMNERGNALRAQALAPIVAEILLR